MSFCVVVGPGPPGRAVGLSVSARHGASVVVVGPRRRAAWSVVTARGARAAPRREEYYSLPILRPDVFPLAFRGVARILL